MSRCRVVAALGLVVSGLALGVIAATSAAASAATAPGHTIATAGTLGTSDSASGGGGPIDFWKVHLNGGDVVQFEAATSTTGEFSFQLFAVGTTDGDFPTARPFAGYDTDGNQKTVFNLQAPYNGTFILAVCENTNYNCPSTDSGGGTNPMDPYTFTTSLATSVSAKVAGTEAKAAATIAGAPSLGLGRFEAGGAGPIDFWKVHLNGGDVVQFEAATSTTGEFSFQLFGPKTNDGNFPTASSLTGYDTDGNQKTVFTLQAPYSGTFILAVCENTNYNCPSTDSGGGTNPMDPYTFTTRLTGGFETRTALKLSAASVRYGREKGFRFTVRVSAVFGDRSPSGKVVISDGKKALCTAKVVNGKGFCALSSNTKIPAGKYTITGAYTGNRDSSGSGKYALKVTG
jgi:hypothetical protein